MRLTPKVKAVFQDVVDLTNEGLVPSLVAKRLGVSDGFVRRILGNMGVLIKQMMEETP